MDAHQLNRQLNQLVREEPAPVAPWDDLARGRAARQRRRSVGTVGALSLAGCTLAAGVWLAAAPGTGIEAAAGGPAAPIWPTPNYVSEEPKVPDVYADPDRLPSTTVPEYLPELVTAEVAAERCVASQRADYPNVTADPTDILVSPLYAGDQVEIPVSDPGGDLSGCSFVSGPLDPAPYPYLPDGASADDTDAIITACADYLRIDFAGWTVGASMADGYGGLAATLVSPRQGYVVSCQLQSSGDLNGFQDVLIDNQASLPALHDMTLNERAPGLAYGTGPFEANFSECYPSYEFCVGESTSWAGVLPRGMESATVVLADGTEIPVPVGPHGTYALRFVSAPGSDPQIHTSAADGSEIGSWPLRQPQQL